MKILVVGTGSIGKRHIRNLHYLGLTDIVTYRTRRTGSSALEKELKIKSFFNLDDALQQGPQLAVIANPTAFHVSVALRCADYGCHLFIEKPVSHNLDGLHLLAEKTRERDIRVMVGYNLRFHPLLLRTESLLQQGAIGRVYAVNVWCGQHLPDWHPNEDYRQSYVARSDLGGGVLLTLSHEIDYLYWLLGPIREILAVGGEPGILQMQTESLVELLVTFESGAIGRIHLDCLRRRPSRGFEILGSDGELVGDLLHSRLDVRVSSYREPVTETLSLESNGTYLSEITHFIECLRLSKEPKVPLEEAVQVVKVCIAARRAAETGVSQRVV